MLRFQRSDDLKSQSQQLLYLGVALIVVAALAIVLSGAAVFPLALAGLGVGILFCALFFRSRVSDVYIVLAIVAFLIGRVVSYVIVWVVYLLGISVTGGLLKLTGMDRLQKRHLVNRSKTTMFENAIQTDADSYERQS